MCDRTCYHLVLGLGGVALYSVVSALQARTCTRAVDGWKGVWRTGWVCCKINFLKRERSHNSCETKPLRWLGTDGKHCMSHILVHSSCGGFCQAFSQKFLWCISPAFERLHINHGWQAARLSCWRHFQMWSVPTGIMYCSGKDACIRSSVAVFVRYPSEVKENHILCYVTALHFTNRAWFQPWEKKMGGGGNSAVCRRKYPAKQKT